jgi:hypothetical protein
VRNILTYASGLAALTIISMGQIHAACGGGGYSPPAKAAPVVSAAPERTAAAAVRVERTAVVSAGLDSSHFDAKSSELNLSKSQFKEIAEAKNDIKNEHAKLLKAQSRAQTKFEECDGDCAKATRDLARATHALQAYNMNAQFDLRLRSILRSYQATAYFNS